MFNLKFNGFFVFYIALGFANAHAVERDVRVDTQGTETSQIPTYSSTKEAQNRPSKGFGRSQSSNSLESLFHTIKTAQQIDKENEERLPTMMNINTVVGYLNMPSARTNRTGTAYLGAAYHPPYSNIGANLQIYEMIEGAVNYRLFNDQPESNFGNKGFGDDADRMASVKFAFSPLQRLHIPLPDLAVGFDDFYGSRRFYSLYVVGTQVFKPYNLELTFGWGKGRTKGYFGAVAFSPWRFSNTVLLKDVTLFAEYDANNYAENPDEHLQGRESKSKVNVGIAWKLLDLFKFKVATLRGKTWSASAGMEYNLGESNGFLPKIQDPAPYSAPINHEPLGPNRDDQELAYELALAFGNQGLNATRIYLQYNEKNEKVLWIQLINLRYFMTRDARERIQSVLSALIPEDVEEVIVALEEGSLIVQTYTYSRKDLLDYNKGNLTDAEMAILAPPREYAVKPDEYDSTLLFKRDKTIWSLLFRPRLLSFFGSTTGKYKYALGVIGGPQGYLFDSLYYKMQLAYNIISSNQNVGDIDVYNPSQLLNVRSDSINYYKSNTVSLEKLYLQRGWNFGRGLYTRVAAGYFESAFAGIASEALFYPMDVNWAIGVEAAGVMKRQYRGLGFQTRVRKLVGKDPEYVKYIGYQYFLDYYYYVKPLDIGIKCSIGQFLARDRGAKLTVTRYFPSGFQFSFWVTATNAHDQVNGKIYHDKGVAFVIPFDFFLHKNSRSVLGYGMSFWQRDQGAVSATGRPLYPVVNESRLYN